MTNTFKKECDRVLVVGSLKNLFEKHVVKCINDIGFKCFHSKIDNAEDMVMKKGINTVIINAMEKTPFIDDILKFSKMEIHKLIYLENANSIYLNSKNKTPYSVYEKVEPSNQECIDLLKIEEAIKANFDHVIFRIAESYGPNIKSGLLSNLLNNITFFSNIKNIDMIYEGDLISAIEIAVQTEALGEFDISSGMITKFSDIVKLIEGYKKEESNVKMTNEQDIIYNCENYKFYKWEPLVNFETGFKSLIKKKAIIY